MSSIQSRVQSFNYNWRDIQEENIRIPKDFKIEYVKLYPWNGAEPIDLTNVRITINFFEDIFNNFLVGNISLIDTWDLPMLYPLIGEEKLSICFFRPGTKLQGGNDIYPGQPQTLEESQRYELEFRVIKMTDRQLMRDKTQQYVLHFVSPEFLENKKKKVQRTYNDMLYSDIVADIYDSFLNVGKGIEIEPTMYLQDFAVSNYTPAQAINIVASRSLADGRIGSSHLFFENLTGYRFVTLEYLFEQPPLPGTLVYQLHNVYVDGINKAIREDVQNVEGYDFVEYFDVVSNLTSGMYCSRLLTYDLVRRIFVEYDYDYLEGFDQTIHLADNKLCSDTLDVLGNPQARFSLMGTNKDHDIIPWIADKEPGIMPTHIEEYVQQRQSLLQQINNVRISITLPGDTDRRVGDIIEFALPNAMSDPQRFGDEPEKYLSGKYLIAAMRHRIEKDSYFQDIELVKDSFRSPIEYEDPIPIYEQTG